MSKKARASRNKGKKWYATYKMQDRQLKNQERKRARHAKKHPNDEQSQKNAKAGYKRQKPQSPNMTTEKVVLRDEAGNVYAWPEFKPRWMLEGGE
jgi:hypothetical protein